MYLAWSQQMAPQLSRVHGIREAVTHDEAQGTQLCQVQEEMAKASGVPFPSCVLLDMNLFH